ncbi:hypothetical protein TIFTF001_047050 [Ficus carica]|uniref:Uncharacterized protein n=1 Tax=Ficus carica TaxID=3494 RepID=A0AA87YQ50_FICCA|nr:hypothetical protein TIFTF001_047047 [Ficus carica]GMN20156.1 hypothetical protein TIFTF001_047050 [Ficus carica]
MADFRNRLKPAVPENRMGNCGELVVNYRDLIKTLKESADEDPLTVVAAEVNEMMKKLEEDVHGRSS